MHPYDIHMDHEFHRIWLRTSPSATWTEIARDGNQTRFTRGGSGPPTMTAYPLPSDLLIQTGLLTHESLLQGEKKEGLLPDDYGGDAHRKYFLFWYAKQQELFILQQNIPETPSQFKGLSLLAARYIDRFGKCFSAINGKLESREGTLLVPRTDALTPISLELLLRAGLTTKERVEAVGGKYVFQRNRRFRLKDWQ